MKNIKKYFIGMILFIMIIFGGGEVYATEMCLNCGIFSEYSKINYGTTYSINNSIVSHRTINNSSSSSNIYFIPYKRTTDWNAFKNNNPTGISISCTSITHGDRGGTNCGTLSCDSGYEVSGSACVVSGWTLGVSFFPMHLK